MIEVTKKTVERAMLIALDTKEFSKETVEEHIEELEELAATAGAETIFKIIQTKRGIDPAFYIGKGKAEELAQLIELNEINIVIFDDDLTPVQVRNLEKLFNRKVIDRSGLILDIFASRAKTKEAKTQVELAQLQYMLPRLTRAWTHLSKQYGGIGTKGPGETQIETDRRLIRTRISLLKNKLEKIEAHRMTQSSGRKGFLRIAIAGYTNAGKSTLFNLLTEANVFAENKLFATLDSTTRSLDIDDTHKILISDTVGFIRKLPAHLIASFKSTLNEVRDADIILHVIDISHPYFEDHIKVVDETLKEFGSAEKRVIKVFNKVDIVSDKSLIDFVKNVYKESVIISASRGINISSLKTMLKNILNENIVEEKIELPLTATKKASQIHEFAEVLKTEYDDNKIQIIYRTSRQNSEKIKKIIAY
ncbi:GTP-binding protein HflX [Ignavibacterium album JCM 16511]|uniref:GTPase HflX n=1 Tax=Ignavibacterium album (strain DSM 19864 / JCM 16511 / NBRC 101810 / Mat9-16) TaxID=945713 RepID=I0ANL5_IGNAJ|nr:GTPase HflX [Ignavibacterium album]AFH50572.1 GTP-binding protein HflX [Ignavibacterium album JCM 16511]